MKDQRYALLKTLIEKGNINRLDECFRIIHKTNIARDSKIVPETFNRRIQDVGLFDIVEVHALADLFELSYKKINDVIYNQYLQQHTTKDTATYNIEHISDLTTLFESGEIKRLDECFNIIPKTYIAKGAHIAPDKFNRRLSDVGLFKIKEVHALAKLFQIEYAQLNDIIYAQFVEERKIKKPNDNAFQQAAKTRKSQAP